MTDYEKMIQILYKAAADGVAKLIKNGLAFTVMSMCIAGLVWGITTMNTLHRQEVYEIKTDMLQIRKEHALQLNDLRREVAACIDARMLDAARIARLEALLQSKK